MDPALQIQAASFTMQQGVAVAVLIAVAVAALLAIRYLVKDAKDERVRALEALQQAQLAGTAALAKANEDCREEREKSREQLGAHLDKLAGAVDGLRETVSANTRATDRLSDRLIAPIGGRAA